MAASAGTNPGSTREGVGVGVVDSLADGDGSGEGDPLGVGVGLTDDAEVQPARTIAMAMAAQA
jgi:hypothetical protein